MTEPSIHIQRVNENNTYAVISTLTTGQKLVGTSTVSFNEAIADLIEQVLLFKPSTGPVLRRSRRPSPPNPMNNK